MAKIVLLSENTCVLFCFNFNFYSRFSLIINLTYIFVVLMEFTSLKQVYSILEDVMKQGVQRRRVVITYET